VQPGLSVPYFHYDLLGVPHCLNLLFNDVMTLCRECDERKAAKNSENRFHCLLLDDCYQIQSLRKRKNNGDAENLRRPCFPVGKVITRIFENAPIRLDRQFGKSLGIDDAESWPGFFHEIGEFVGVKAKMKRANLCAEVPNQALLVVVNGCGPCLRRYER